MNFLPLTRYHSAGGDLHGQPIIVNMDLVLVVVDVFIDADLSYTVLCFAWDGTHEVKVQESKDAILDILNERDRLNWGQNAT